MHFLSLVCHSISNLKKSQDGQQLYSSYDLLFGIAFPSSSTATTLASMATRRFPGLSLLSFVGYSHILIHALIGELTFIFTVPNSYQGVVLLLWIGGLCWFL